MKDQDQTREERESEASTSTLIRTRMHAINSIRLFIRRRSTTSSSSSFRTNITKFEKFFHKIHITWNCYQKKGTRRNEWELRIVCCVRVCVCIVCMMIRHNVVKTPFSLSSSFSFIFYFVRKSIITFHWVNSLFPKYKEEKTPCMMYGTKLCSGFISLYSAIQPSPEIFLSVLVVADFS